MANQPRITCILNSKERLWGWLWLMFQLLALPRLLHMANAALGNPLNGSWISVLFSGINFLVTVLIFRKFLGRSLENFGMRFFRCLRGAFLGFCVYYVTNMALGNLLRLLVPGYTNVNDGQVASLLHLSYLPMGISTVVLVPVAEELLYRGLLFQGFYVRNPRLGYALSVVLFSLVHLLPYLPTADIGTLVLGFVQYIPAGLCLAWAYTEADNIFAPILIHAVVNAISIYAVR
jgi:membrane protease YdiL (CAAX protease family)